MDQDVARRLLFDGATLLIVGVPEGTQFGIDLKSWETGEKFRGVKMIPPGVHYVYYSAVSQHGDTAPRIGFLYNFKKSEFVVRKWNKTEGDIDHNKTASPEEEQRLRSNLLELDQYLGSYPYDIWDKWKLFSNLLTEPLVQKLMPASGIIRSALELIAPPAPVGKEKPSAADTTLNIGAGCSVDSQDTDKTKSSEDSSASNLEPESRVKRRRSRPLTIEEREEDLLPHLQPTPGTALRLTSFAECNYPPGSTPSEITFHSMDSTYALEVMLQQHQQDVDLVGELQFSFVCFLVGHSLDAFEHWKRLVVLVCNCEKAISQHHKFYEEFLWALEPQLWEVQEDFLADIVSNDNAIYRGLRNLFRAIQAPDNQVEPRFKTRAARFRDRLTEKFLWDFSDLDIEDEDEAPVVVEL